VAEKSGDYAAAANDYKQSIIVDLQQGLVDSRASGMRMAVQDNIKRSLKGISRLSGKHHDLPQTNGI
jgi:hypothetical protein